LPEARFSSFRISAGDRNSAYPPRVVRVFNSLNSSSALNGAVHGSCFGHREDEFNGTTPTILLRMLRTLSLSVRSTEQFFAKLLFFTETIDGL